MNGDGDTNAKQPEMITLVCRCCGETIESYCASTRTQKYYICQDCSGLLPQCPMFQSTCKLDECTAYTTFIDQNARSSTYNEEIGFCQMLNTHLPTLKTL